jgi:multiple sugar transport system permease protein
VSTQATTPVQGDAVAAIPPGPPATDTGGPRRWWRPTGNPVLMVVKLAVLTACTIIFIYPFLWAISASLKPREEVFDNKLIPQHFQWKNYVDVFTGTDIVGYHPPFAHWLFNSMYIGVLAAITVTFSSALVAFGFAYFRFPLRNVLFGCVLATMMLPGAVTMIPVYLIWNKLGLTGTQYPLWAQNLFGSAFYIFLLRQFFLGIPRELFEAARIDGDNFFTMFWRIAAPLAWPALIVTAVFEFKASWTDLMKPLIYLNNDSEYTLPRGLKNMLDLFGPSGGGNGDYQIVMAGLVLATIPMIIIFFLGQRFFVEGIATSGRKG